MSTNMSPEKAEEVYDIMRAAEERSYSQYLVHISQSIRVRPHTRKQNDE